MVFVSGGGRVICVTRRVECGGESKKIMVGRVKYVAGRVECVVGMVRKVTNQK
jgi:hypothetical protein